MISVKVITVGTLKEGYLRDAVAEYSKRLSGYCKFTLVQLKEARIGDVPSQKEIAAALDEEAKAILAELSPRSYKIAMCVEGKQLSSEAFADKIENISLERSEICFVIGSSYGISDKIKDICDFKMSVSQMTFPHQLIRVILLESIYRAFNITAGTKYHK